MELRVEQQEAQLQRDSVSVRPPSAHADAQRALSVSARRAERPEVGRQRQCVRGAALEGMWGRAAGGRLRE
jgi:hypothetical protein